MDKGKEPERSAPTDISATADLVNIISQPVSDEKFVPSSANKFLIERKHSSVRDISTHLPGRLHADMFVFGFLQYVFLRCCNGIRAQFRLLASKHAPDSSSAAPAAAPAPSGVGRPRLRSAARAGRGAAARRVGGPRLRALAGGARRAPGGVWGAGAGRVARGPRVADDPPGLAVHQGCALPRGWDRGRTGQPEEAWRRRGGRDSWKGGMGEGADEGGQEVGRERDGARESGRERARERERERETERERERS